MQIPLRILLLSALLTGLPVSCRKESDGGHPATVVVTISSGSTDRTRTATATDAAEDQVNDLQVFVFEPGGTKDGYGHRTSSGDIAVSTHTGVHDIWAVTNAPDLSAIDTRETLQATVARLDRQDLGDFIHIGHLETDLTSHGTVCLSPAHLVSRCVLRKFTNRLEPESLASGTFTLTDLFLTNVAGDGNLGGTTPSTLWYNRMGLQNELDRFLHDEIPAPGGTLAPGSSYENGHRFYMMPNGTDGDDRSPAWSPRRTRLVARTTLDGEAFFYPVTLPPGAGNLSFEVTEMVAARIGVKNPETDTPFTAIIYDIDLQEFTETEHAAGFQAISSAVVFSEPGVSPFTLLSREINLQTDRFALLQSDGSIGPWDPVFRLAEGALGDLPCTVFVGGISSFEEITAHTDLTRGSSLILSFGSDVAAYEELDRFLSITGDSNVQLVVTNPTLTGWSALETALITGTIGTGQ